MQFTWAEKKRAANNAKHGIDFVRAMRMFDGSHRHDVASPHAQKRRYLSTALVDGVFFTVVWTMRGEDTIRIISARRSRSEEKGKYRQLHG
jgi:uncharacterized protein